MIEIRNLEKKFGEIKVLSNISISIEEGEIYGIIGHSGAGKSTLLRCINGLESYNKGSLKIMENDVSDLKGKDLRNFRKNWG